MGVDTKLVVYSPGHQTAAAACRAAFDRIAELEDVMSDYRPKSELMQLCAKSGGTPAPVSEDLFRVLSAGQQIARQSNGAFDMTLGPLVQLWRTTRKTQTLPDAATLAHVKSLVGYDKIRLDPDNRTAELTAPGMRLDLGGIAKGDAGDQALQVLRAHGITRALFQSGGDIVVADPPPDTAGWAINIPHPPTANPITAARGSAPEIPTLQPTPTPTESTLLLSNCAISTSGDSNQFVEINHTRYSHLLDPRTGLGLTARTLVTVIAPTGLVSDPLSKAASLLPPDQLRALLANYPKVTVYTRTVPLGE